MSNGSHLSKDLLELIKAIGETRSKQEEDKMISLEAAQLRQSIDKPNLSPKKQKENLIRAIYIEMLGHDSAFAHIHAVNLTQAKALPLKKIGYLVCSLFLHSDSTIQIDLQSENVLEVLTALNALARLISLSIVDALLEQLIKLVAHSNELIRKKAMMILHKVFILDSQRIPDFLERLKKCLYDKDPSVMGASVNLYFEVLRQSLAKGDASRLKAIKELTSSFVVILKQIIEHKLNRDYDYKRMPAPWIQIKLLQVLAILGEKDQKVSEQIYEVLQSTLKRADDTGTNIGYAITYQCVLTIARIHPHQPLLELAAQSVGRFLTCENNNLKYLGINALISIINVNSQHAMEHQMTVVECLENQDETLKRKTFQLLYKMTNHSNVEVIVDKLINFLKQTYDTYFQKEMVNKITELAEKYAPDQAWYLATMTRLFMTSSQHITSEILGNLIGLVKDNYAEFGEEYADFLFDQLDPLLEQPDELPDSLVKLLAWVYGEIGHAHFDGCALLAALDRLSLFLQTDFESPLTKGWVLNAMVKLSLRVTDPQAKATLHKTVASFRESSHPAVLQQRAIEYTELSGHLNGLVDSLSLQPDASLSFLDGYVQQALAKGARPYDPKQTTQGFIDSLGLGLKKNLNYQPYQQKAEDNQTGLKLTGHSNWTKNKQYKKDEKKVVAGNFKNLSSQSMQSTKDKSVTNTEQKTNMQSISSDDFKSSLQSGVKNTAKPESLVPVKEEPPKEVAQHKKILAQNLFAGFDGQLQQQKKTHSFGQQKQFTKKIAPKPTKEIDLLGEDGGQDLIDPVDMGPVTPPRPFSPYSINLEEFEQHWESINDEIEFSFSKSNIRSDQQFQTLLDSLQFHLVELIDHEFICAAKDSSQNLVLMYADIDIISGTTNLTIKNHHVPSNQTTLSLLKDAFSAQFL